MQVREILVLVFALPLFGCGDLNWFSTQMDPKTKPTYQFWASLQGIHHKNFPEIRRMMDEIKAAIEESDWDHAAELLHKLGNEHQTMAQQFRGLGHENVDAKALAFRDQLVRSHHSLAEGSNRLGTGIKERDFEVIHSGQSLLVRPLQEHAELWESGIEVMEILEAKYGKDFNVQQ